MALREERLAALGEVAQRVAPVTLAQHRTLAVLPPLAPLFPDGGLRRGSTVSVSAPSGTPGATSLALATVAGASAQGSWCVAVGWPSLGLVAAVEVGVDLDRFPQVRTGPGAKEWATAVAALLDGCDLVLARPPARVRAADARRLAARARERGSVLVVAGGWPEAPDVSFAVERVEWEGLGDGHGHLRARRVEVVASGRRGAARERRRWLWLPAPGGGVAEAPAPAAGPAAVHHLDRTRRDRPRRRSSRSRVS